MCPSPLNTSISRRKSARTQRLKEIEGNWLIINGYRKSQLLVSCGGGRRPADGLRKQHVRTIRLPVWDTLEDFSPLWTHVGRDEDRLRKHAACTWIIQLRMTDEHRKYWIFLLRSYIARTWVFKAIHVEEMMDKRTTCNPGSSPAWRRSPTFSQLKQKMCRDIARRTWEAL
jgi:hypothetical protein